MHTEKSIQNTLLQWYYPRGKRIACTNSKYSYFEECDVLIVDPKTLMTYDYEIKISKQDFKADFKKVKHKYYTKKQYYHSNISSTPVVANYFYYVVPKDLVNVSEIPKYAGLIYISGKEVEVIKRAPKIHKSKAPDKLIMYLLQNLTAKMIYGCSYMNWKNKQNK